MTTTWAAPDCTSAAAEGHLQGVQAGHLQAKSYLHAGGGGPISSCTLVGLCCF